MDTTEKNKQITFSFLKKILHWLQVKWDRLVVILLAVFMICGAVWYALRYTHPQELAIRQRLVETASTYLNINEADGSHQTIVDLYNCYRPHPRGYTLTYEDNWCAAFGSAVAMKAGLDGQIPIECSCQQQILLFAELGAWKERDCYLPKPGDYIYYVWDEWRRGDCTAWANHVGIVTETFGPIIKVIEGNKDDAVGYRYIFLNDITIRGFGLPDYAQLQKFQ